MSLVFTGGQLQAPLGEPCCDEDEQYHRWHTGPAATLRAGSELVVHPRGCVYSAKEVPNEWEVGSDRWHGATSQKV